MSLYTLKYFKKLIIKEKEIIENGEDPTNNNVNEENSVERGEFTLCAPQIPRRILIIANDGGNFVPIS
jgi:hypothetical protein